MHVKMYFAQLTEILGNFVLGIYWESRWKILVSFWLQNMKITFLRGNSVTFTWKIQSFVRQ